MRLLRAARRQLGFPTEVEGKFQVMLVYTLPTGDMTAGFAFVLGRQAQAKFERKNLYTFSDVILLQVTLYIPITNNYVLSHNTCL
jgi:hypothetical protein